MMLDPVEPRVIAVLDWELSTIGHPLGDLAYACMLFHHTDYPREKTRAAGIPDEQELIDIYCAETGREGVSNWPFYIAFSKFRLSAIAQGVYKRGLDGNASSQTALRYHNHARKLAGMGWSVITGS